jgi:hypothetical protein
VGRVSLTRKHVHIQVLINKELYLKLIVVVLSLSHSRDLSGDEKVTLTSVMISIFIESFIVMDLKLKRGVQFKLENFYCY